MRHLQDTTLWGESTVDSAVDVYVLSMDGSVAPDEYDRSTLSSDESARANRLVRNLDRVHFICVRATLRRLLAERLGVRGADVTFKYGPRGKPEIAGSNPWKFNVSHSSSTAVIAICNDQEIGIDVEAITDDLPEVLDQVFDPAETRRIRESSDPVRSFYRHWTRKEALVKGLGIGLTDRPADLAVNDFGVDKQCGFVIFPLQTRNGYEAAIAIQSSRPPSVRTHYLCRA